VGELNIILRELNIILEKHLWEAVGLILLIIYGPLYLRHLSRWVYQGNKGRRFDDSKVWGQEP